MDLLDTRDPHRSRRQRAAVIAALWTALLFATVPLVRTVQRWLSERGWDRWITVSVMTVLVLLVTVAVLRLLARRPHPGTADVAWLAVVAAVAIGWAWRLRGRPEEAVHLVEYGILCWLIYRAIRPAEPDVAVLLSAALLGTLTGTVDEIIQWITPERYWDFRDVGLNAGACGLGALVAWRLDEGPWQPPQIGSVRMALRLAAALVILIALCLANTPNRVAWYAARIPGLGFLAHPANEMAEYGHFHRLSGVGKFKSRMTMDELVEQDRRRASEAAEIIDRFPDAAYNTFHRDHQGFADPLTYEARIHLFGRNYNAKLARQRADDPDELKLRSTLAYRENQILEQAFTNTLRRSGKTLEPEVRRELEALHDPDWPFISRAGTHLITWISEPVLRAVLVLVAVVLMLLERAVGNGWRIRVEGQP